MKASGPAPPPPPAAFDPTLSPPQAEEALVVLKGGQRRGCCRSRRCRLCGYFTLALLLLSIITLVAYFAEAYSAYHAVKPRHISCTSSPSSNITTINGFDLWTRLLGVNTTAPPLMVIHGGPGHNSQSFKGSLDRLAAHRRVLLFDQRGSGLSEMKAPGGYGVADVVEDMENLRSALLQEDKMVVLAHSTGGAIAQHYVATYPDRVRALILVGSTTSNNDMSNRWLWHTLGPGLYATAMGLPPKDPAKADAWFMKVGNRADTKRLYDAHRNASVLVNTGPSRFSTWFSISQSLAGNNLYSRLRRFQAPVLIIYGEADDRYTGGPTAHAIREEAFPQNPHVQVVAIPRSSHWPFLENPGDFFSVVEGFLRQDS